MLDFLALLFSPSGTVGRGIWWATQIVTFFLMIFLFTAAGVIIYHFTPHTRNGPVSADATRALILGLILLAVAVLPIAWTNLVIEIKRWHDRGMSGFMVLLRLVPVFFSLLIALSGNGNARMGQYVGVPVTIVVQLYMFIQLGFLPGEYLSLSQVRQSRGARLQQSASVDYSLVGLFLLAGALGLFDLVLFALLYFGPK